MAFISARGIHFHIQRLTPAGQADEAPAVVFIHGLVMDNLSSFYYTLAGPVVGAGAQAVLYDQRGHGRSERPSAGYTAADAVADLVGILDELGLTRSVYLVANSFGGVVALGAALAHPHRVAGLVLIEAYGAAERSGEWTEDMLNTLTSGALVLEYDEMADQLLAVGWRKRGRQAAIANALLNGTTLIDDLAVAEPVRPAELAALTCPVLALYGEHSDVIDAGRLLARHVPHCTLHIIRRHAHTVLREATHELRDTILGWLAIHAGTAASPAGVFRWPGPRGEGKPRW
jgi:Predicted hydrolases or acyltransferases (alpha/beta hydrolase superfamily)